MTNSQRRRNLAATLCVRIAITCFTCGMGSTPAGAQVEVHQPASAFPLQITAISALPDAPEVTQSTPAANSPSGQIPPEEQQTKRILWIMPNFRAVSTGTKLPKQSVKEKGTPLTRPRSSGRERPLPFHRAYYPLTYQNWTKVGQRGLTNILLDGGTFGAKEFWPDVNRAIFHQRE